MARHGESFYANQSINGLLNRLFFNGTNLHGNPHAFAPFNRWIYLATLATSIVLVAVALIRRRPASREGRDEDFLFAALAFTVASPIAWEHHYSILLPIFVVTLALLWIENRGKGRIWLLALAFCLTSNSFVMVNALANTRLNFLQSHIFFGAAILLALLYRLSGGPRGSLQAGFPEAD
jgi:alpha-1,2-mannosyltransferase